MTLLWGIKQSCSMQNKRLPRADRPWNETPSWHPVPAAPPREWWGTDSHSLKQTSSSPALPPRSQVILCQCVYIHQSSPVLNSSVTRTENLCSYQSSPVPNSLVQTKGNQYWIRTALSEVKVPTNIDQNSKALFIYIYISRVHLCYTTLFLSKFNCTHGSVQIKVHPY